MPPDFTTPGQIHFKISKEQILNIKYFIKVHFNTFGYLVLQGAKAKMDRH